MLESLLKLVTGAQGILVAVVSVLFVVSFIAFMAAIISFLVKRAKGEAKTLEQAKDMLWWSVFAMFVLMAVWGIVVFIASNLGIGLGGCASRPSAVPGVSAIGDCTNSGSSSGALSPSSCSSKPYASGCSCSVDNDCESYLCRSRRCVTADVANPIITPPTNRSSATTGALSGCSSGGGRAAANGDVIYCANGRSGEPCEGNTCAEGLRCDVKDDGERGICTINN